jgi:DNA polymerase
VTTFYGDTETYCETPLNHGLHRYAEDVEITIFAWALDDGPVEVIDCTAPGWEDKVKVALAAADAADEQVWQNSAFDRTVLRHAWGYEMPLERIWDTMVQALAHSLPGSLDTLCSILGVPVDLSKHKAGKSLVQLFCKPRPKNQKIRRATRHTHPVEWQRFLDYAGSDIVSMREVKKRMPKWNYPGNARERALWVLDQKINDRGVAVDLALAAAAVRATDLAKVGLKAKTQMLTGFDPETGQGLESTTKRDAFLKYLLGEFGVDLPNMQKGTLERRLADENLPEPVKDLLRIRLMATVTSTTKYKALMRGTSSDGRLRGTLQFCGAARTGRWAGRLFQPQNLMRPTLKQQAILDAIEAFLADCADLLYDNVMNVAANCTRGALTVGPGKKMVSSDLANIEGRFLAWLAGEEWKLRAFRDYDTLRWNPDGSPLMVRNKKGELEQAREGPDLYHVGASEVLGIKVEDVTDDQRQAQGKVPELACLLEGTLVLTARGEVPIETVLPGDFVWDGTAWVQTDGPVFKGEKRVITYDGLCATPDHLVWVEGQADAVELGRAAADGLRLVRTGPRNQARAPELGPQADRRQATLHEPQGQGVQKLRRPGREVRLPDGSARLRLGAGEPRAAAPEARSGSGGQRRGLRGREPALVDTPGQQVAHAAQQEVNGLASVPANTPGGPVRGHDTEKLAGDGPDLRADNREVDTAELQTQGRVWDLLNCGPLHRFTAAGRLVHNCGYQGAVGAFQSMARIYGLEMSDARALEIVKAWRKKNKHIVDLWYEAERAAIRAAEQPGLRVEVAGGKLVFQRDGSWLRMRLPSGRCLCYPGVAVEDGKLTYMGVNQYTRRFEQLHTYGGKIIENATQAGSRDVLAHNMPAVEAAGYSIVLGVHDELVAETPDTEAFTSSHLSALMSAVPPWAAGLPLAASGWEGARYRK